MHLADLPRATLWGLARRLSDAVRGGWEREAWRAVMMAGSPWGPTVLCEPGWVWPETQRCSQALT